jgi:hypothetical protein
VELHRVLKELQRRRGSRPGSTVTLSGINTQCYGNTKEKGKKVSHRKEKI